MLPAFLCLLLVVNGIISDYYQIEWLKKTVTPLFVLMIISIPFTMVISQ